MLKNIFLVFLLISSMAFAEYQAKVETDVLNVRAKRSASSHVISKLNKGDEITVYSCEKGFCEIALGLKKGYVSEKFISPIERNSQSQSAKSNNKFGQINSLRQWVLMIGILTGLLLLALFALSKTIPKLLYFSLIAALLYSLCGVFIYGMPFVSVIVFGFIGVFVLMIPVKLLQYAFGDQTATKLTDEGWKRQREEIKEKIIVYAKPSKIGEGVIFVKVKNGKDFYIKPPFTSNAHKQRLVSYNQSSVSVCRDDFSGAMHIVVFDVNGNEIANERYRGF